MNSVLTVCQIILASLFLLCVIDAAQQEARIDSSFQYVPYYRGPVCTPSHAIMHPTTVQEVQKIVHLAIESGITVKAFGSRHSITDILCTSGIPIDMTGIGGMKINQWDHSVTVGAGVNVHDLCEFLKMHGRALKIIPGFGNITVGGAIGTGAHGSTLKFTSTISDQVIGLTIIDGHGIIRNISDNEELRLFRVHLGLLGIVLSATLRTEPLYKLRCHNYLIGDSILFNGSFISSVKHSDIMSLYWFPSAERLVVSNCTIVDENVNGEAWTNDHVPSTYFEVNAALVTGAESVQQLDPVIPNVVYTVIEQVQDFTMLTLLRTMPRIAPIYTYDGVTVSNPAVGYYHRMIAPICDDKGELQCPFFHGPFNLTQLDSEFTVDINAIPKFVRTVKDIITKYPAAFPVQGILLRFSPASDTYMSNAFGKNICHFEFYMLNRANPYETATAGLPAYQTIWQSMLFNYHGKPHWGKAGMVYHSAEVLEKTLNPVSKEAFLELMHKYDPNGLFLNDFGHRLLGTGTKMNRDPKVTRCALLDDCFCSSDGDCASYQTCGSIPGYNFPVCLNRVLLGSLGNLLLG